MDHNNKSVRGAFLVNSLMQKLCETTRPRITVQLCCKTGVAQTTALSWLAHTTSHSRHSFKLQDLSTVA